MPIVYYRHSVLMSSITFEEYKYNKNSIIKFVTINVFFRVCKLCLKRSKLFVLVLALRHLSQIALGLKGEVLVNHTDQLTYEAIRTLRELFDSIINLLLLLLLLLLLSLF